MTTPRQQAWLDAAKDSPEPAATFFRALAMPNEQERGHVCRDDIVGFRQNGRRGLKCGICGSVIRWVDPDPEEAS